MNQKPLAFIDVETTGLSPTRDRVIEIGIIRVEENKIVGSINKLVNPQLYISPIIQNITNINQEELEVADSFQDMSKEIYELLDGATFVAHSVRFDYSFIRNEFKRLGYTFTAPLLCTAKLSRRLYPQHRRHNLTSIINRFGFVCDRRHRAYDDAHVLWQFYQHIQTHISEEALKIATNRVQKRPTIPQHLDPQEVDDLPESHGVYFFYDMDNILLYIGKANNIRARVLSHFSNDNSSAKELAMCPQIARVEYVETAGELGALLRESNYIKTMQPLYNRLMRNKKKLNIVKESVNEHGYKTATMKQVDSITVADLETIIGVFKSKKHGLTKLSEISEKHKLCKKLLSVESGKGPCFDYHLQLCNGACIQKEIPLKYNMRMTLARAENRLRPWLYDSAIEVIEKSNDTMRVERFIIDQWCVIESNTNNGDSSLPTGYIFDMDTYTILNRYFKSRTKNTIHSLKQDNTPVRNAKPVHIP